jgi:hypothetical protein
MVDSGNFKDQIERELDEANALALTSEIFGSTREGSYLPNLITHPVITNSKCNEALQLTFDSPNDAATQSSNTTNNSTPDNR